MADSKGVPVHPMVWNPIHDDAVKEWDSYMMATAELQTTFQMRKLINKFKEHLMKNPQPVEALFTKDLRPSLAGCFYKQIRQATSSLGQRELITA